MLILYMSSFSVLVHLPTAAIKQIDVTLDIMYIIASVTLIDII